MGRELDLSLVLMDRKELGWAIPLPPLHGVQLGCGHRPRKCSPLSHVVSCTQVWLRALVRLWKGTYNNPQNVKAAFVLVVAGMRLWEESGQAHWDSTKNGGSSSTSGDRVLLKGMEESWLPECWPPAVSPQGPALVWPSACYPRTPLIPSQWPQHSPDFTSITQN